jgi:hypothetical protein
MIITLRKDTNILVLPNDYATVEQFDDTNVQIRINIVVSQKNIILKKANTTRITFSTTVNYNNASTSIVAKSQKDSSVWVQEIKQSYTRLFNNVRTTKENILATLNIDNTSAINNSVVSSVNNGSSKGNFFKKQISLKTVSELNDAGQIAPLLLINNNKISSNAPANIDTSLRNVVVENGIDPSFILELPHSGSLFLDQSINGVIQDLKFNKLRRDDVILLEPYFKTIMSPLKTINGTSTNDIDASNIIPYLDVSNSDLVEVSGIISIKLSDLKFDTGGYNNLGIKFDVINTNNQILQTETRQFNFSQYFELLQIPMIPPIVDDVIQNPDGLCLLSVKQIDDNAKSVQIYRKTIQNYNNDIQNYALVNTVNIDNTNGYIKVGAYASQGETTIFRAIAVGKNANFGFDFTNIIVKSTKSEKNDIHVSINASSNLNGVAIEVREIPANVVSYSILRRDLTIFESKPSIVLDKVMFVNSLGSNDNPILTDTLAVDNRTYEYSCRLNFINGSIIDCGKCIFEHKIPQLKAATTEITNLSITGVSTGVDVKFDVKTTISNSSFDAIKQLLENQGLIDYFKDDILNERDKLQNLLTHQIIRVDLTNGIYEDLGIFDGTTFSDFVARNKFGASDLISGHDYRYDIFVLLRASETLFEDFIKTAVDKNTKKQYNYNPFKFFHPITIRDGVVITTDSVNLNYAKSTFSFGNIGNLASIKVSIPVDNCNIVSVSAEILKRNSILVKWNIIGDRSSIDHFIVLNERLGSRTLVGKAHAQVNSPYRLLHTINESERGSYRYIVRIVYNDYKLGPEVLSNEVIF